MKDDDVALHSLPPVTPRPKDLRQGQYLQDTLSKLDGDAQRHDRWPSAKRPFVIDAPLWGNAPPAGDVTCRPVQAPSGVAGIVLGADAEPLPRGLVNSESACTLDTIGGKSLAGLTESSELYSTVQRDVQECMRTMKEVVGYTAMPSRFEEMRKTDLKLSAQAQLHIKELKRLNTSLQQFLDDCNTPDEFAKFKGTIVSLTSCVADLTQTKKDLLLSMDAIAERASKKIMGAWDAELKKSVHFWRDHFQAERDHWDTQQKRWLQLDTRLEVLDDRLSQLGEEARQQREQVKVVGQMQKETLAEVNGHMSEGFAGLTGALGKSTKQLEASCGRTAVAVDEFQLQMTKILIGDEAADAQRQSSVQSPSDASSTVEETKPRVRRLSAPLVQSLRGLQAHAADTEAALRQELEMVRRTADDRQEGLASTRADVERLLVIEAHGKQKIQALENQLADLRRDMDVKVVELEAARRGSMNSAMQTLVTLEEKGNIKFNRQTGDLKLLAVEQLKFTPAAPGDSAPAAFADPQASEKVLADLAEVLRLLEVPTEIEVLTKPGKGAAPDWDQLAGTWAQLLKAKLVESGTPERLLTAIGKAPPKGVSATTVNIRLDKSFFPPEDKGGAKGGKKK
eukprot:TRINITY_DN81639_c0_g1_i1.p1 TRINITY_DN81639_c0_g1~~TRINITY_DN81639_c0_g1_i1.p1  ORF type:complete len:624 (+),score=185.37 TRINITY_DN81639_c0_g1_i1:58-1929(+)